ncbi:basic phospholipase A2 homolog textilotoxin B chain-like [Rhopilema esculentum]|uniref:basic phospholipase A2 homolog textilotoxin B chain-like n=1 Tax=Rhopilema esculentum TaxID=499914 RepID=UPI0031D37FD0
MKKLFLLLTICAFFVVYYHKPVEANLLQLCEQIDYFKKFEWSAGCLEFADYGCFCGPGGWGKPADEVDACCMVHDHCYDAAMAKFPYCYPYVSYYHHETGVCHDKNDTCDRFVCECDRALARCLVFKRYHAKYINYRYLGHCKTNGTKYILK